MAQYITFQPSDYFNCKLWTGTGSSNAISGVGFSPDMVWMKRRDGTTDHHLHDIQRGATYKIQPSDTGSNNADAQTLTSFDSDGFTVGTSSQANASSAKMVAWNWEAGGAGSTNSNGSTSSTVSVSTTAGFSIVRYTNPSSGAPFTVGHGLGVAPKMIWTKKLNGSQTWGIWHSGIGFGKYLRLDVDSAEASANLVTATSATTFSTYKDHHDTGDDIIAYCFAEVQGFSKIGTYFGNNSSWGTFVNCGFEPNFIMIKRVGSSAQWQMRDGQRGVNGKIRTLYADSTEQETSGATFDIHSNGFKPRNNSNVHNAAEEYVYIAFAKSPVVASNKDPNTAR